MNGNENDDMTACDGMSGQQEHFYRSWEFSQCDEDEPVSQVVSPCGLNSVTTQRSVHDLCFWIGKSEVFGECLMDYQELRRLCAYDMCTSYDQTNNCPFCTVLTVAALECARSGFPISWTENQELDSLCYGEPSLLIISRPLLK